MNNQINTGTYKKNYTILLTVYMEMFACMCVHVYMCVCTSVSFLIACSLFAVSKWDQSREDKSGSAVICLEMSGSGWDQPSDQRHTKEIYPWEKLQ